MICYKCRYVSCAFPSFLLFSLVSFLMVPPDDTKLKWFLVQNVFSLHLLCSTCFQSNYYPALVRAWQCYMQLLRAQSGLRHSPSLHLYSSDRTWKHCSQNYPHSHRESVCTVITHTGSVQCCLLLHAIPVLLLCCIAFHVNCLCVLLVLAYLSFASVCLCCYDCM